SPRGLHIERERAGEVVHELLGHVLDHRRAAPVLRDLACEIERGLDLDAGVGAIGAQVADHARMRVAAPLEFITGRADHGMMPARVALAKLDSAGELQRDRAETHRDPAFVLIVAYDLGELRAWHAGGHALDVVEDSPRLFDRRRDQKAVPDLK